MAKKSKIPIQERSVNTVKNILTGFIKQISIIAIFLTLGIVSLLYLGPDIEFNLSLQTKLAVTSIVLAISVIILYELWLTNGRNNASEEDDYKKVLETYSIKSEGLHYPTMQEFLDYEYNRRYTVEENRLGRLLDREKSILIKTSAAIKGKLKRWFKLRGIKKRIKKITKAINTIRIKMPYEKSEEFDYLRYNIQDKVYKEYAPEDSTRHLAKARTKKYTSTVTFTIIGLNVLNIGSGFTNNLYEAIIMIALAIITLAMAVVSGFSTGYSNIKIVSMGIYKTGNSFIDQAVAYSKRMGKDLYYKGATEFRDAKPVETKPDPVIELKKEEDIFTRATIEVTETNKY